MKRIMTILCAGCALLAAVAATPRMSLRLRGPHTATEAQWQATFRALAANPGCCDEVWFSTGIGLPPLAWHRAQAARLARAAEDLRKIGVVPSLQFQATLGHSDALSASEDCSAKSWTGWTGSTGVEGRLCSCPRQPAFLAYMRETARLYAAFRPGSVWIDDDLRISNHAPATDKSRVGCWCATCLAAFNAETGGRWTRAALDAAQTKDAALAARWKTFSVQAIAQVARALAEEFHRLSPETTMAYQHCFDDGSVASVRAVARALAEASGRPIGLRPGGGFYYDVNPLDQVVKSFLAAHFRARVPDLEGVVGTWCPEVESWPRAYGSRTAQSALVESFVALAYGFNSTSLLLLDTRYETDDLYARTILKPLADAAPVLAGYAQANEGTVAAGFSAPGLSSARLARWALSGIPVLPGAGTRLGELTAEDCALDVCKTGSAAVQARRDALDARAGGAPAVLESPFMGLLVPHVTAAGALRTVALLNTRIEAQGPVTLRLRGVPAGAAAVWRELRRAPVPLALVRDGACARVTVPSVGAWNGGYVDLARPPTPEAARWDPAMLVANAVVTNGVKWIDGRHLPIEGRAFDDVERYYDRLPAGVTTNVNGGVRGMKRHTSGMLFRFVTDSTRLAFRWTPAFASLAMDHMPATGVSGIDVYRWDAARARWVYAKTGRITDAKGGACDLAWTPGTPCLVNLPLYNGIRSFSLGIDPRATVRPFPHASGVSKPVVFYGTSITHGGCASRPGLGFVNLVGRDLDVPVVGLGFSGSGVMELEMSDHLARIDASCYVLDCLWNMGMKGGRDVPGRNADENYEPFIRNLRAKRPGVPIVMAARCDVWCRGPSDQDRYVRALYEKLLAEGWTNLVYLPKDRMFTGDAEGTVDGCHPNDLGMRSLADAFGAAVRTALGL